MFEPVEAIQIVCSIATAIYDQVQLVKANQAQFQSLAKRIQLIEASLRGLDKIPDSLQFKSALNCFKDCLDDCLTFTREFTDRHWFKRALLASNYRVRFDKLNDQIKQSMMDLNLGLNVQQVMNREQDKKDQQEDYEAIHQKQDEIILLNQKESDQIQELKMQEDERHKIIQRQLQSMLLHIKNININEPQEKPPIDPKLIIPYYDIMFDKKIGAGSLGTIYLARWCEQPTVIKMLEGEFTAEEQEQLIREINIMSRLRSPAIVQFYGACLEPGRICLAMEYMRRGSLYNVLNETSLSSEQQRNIALDIARGLHYLHMQGVLHRNLKSANVLINSTWRAKLTDFGLSKIQSASIMTINKRSQAIQWMAPESIERYPVYTEKSDIYSYGVILWEIMTEKQPYKGMTEEEVVNSIKQGEREEIPQTVPNVYAEIIRNCWLKNPNERPSLIEIIREIERYEIKPLLLSGEDFYKQGVIYEKQGAYKRAYTLYQKSAGKSYSRALTNLGMFALNGLGCKQNKEKAYKLLFESAEKGNMRAQYNLAIMLEHGDGVDKNYDQALYWYQQAASKGDRKSAEKSAQLTNKMT